jgi:hypothetical protein
MNFYVLPSILQKDADVIILHLLPNDRGRPVLAT